MSDISSAGIARVAPGCGKTCRKDVLRRVEVPVVQDAAGRASPRPGGQAQLGERELACRAGLGRGVPAAGHDQLAAGSLALVLQLAAELAPPAVADRPGQAPVADHVGDREVLDRDQVVAADQAGGGLVQEVAAGVGDLAVGPGDLGPCLGPVGRAFPATGEAALVAGEAGSPALQVAGIGDPLAVRRPAAGLASSPSAPPTPGRTTCPCAALHTAPAAPRGSGSIPRARSRRCGSAPPAAPHRDRPGTGTPSARRQPARPCRQNPALPRRAPDSSPARGRGFLRRSR